MADTDTTEGKGRIAAQELRLFVERVERLEEEKQGIADDIKEGSVAKIGGSQR
ncbi:DUF2312 domain-containing protein [Sphingomonas sp. C8-2]|nr:DUF2312 domain-containing protein [Sphingomonas sp. C8-2]